MAQTDKPEFFEADGQGLYPGIFDLTYYYPSMSAGVCFSTDNCFLIRPLNQMETTVISYEKKLGSWMVTDPEIFRTYHLPIEKLTLNDILDIHPHLVPPKDIFGTESKFGLYYTGNLLESRLVGFRPDKNISIRK